MAWVPAQDDMAWKRASTGRGSMPPQKTSFEPHARQPDSFRKPRQGDLILFSQISSIRNEGRHERGYTQCVAAPWRSPAPLDVFLNTMSTGSTATVAIIKSL